MALDPDDHQHNEKPLPETTEKELEPDADKSKKEPVLLSEFEQALSKMKNLRSSGFDRLLLSELTRIKEEQGIEELKNAVIALFELHEGALREKKPKSKNHATWLEKRCLDKNEIRLIFNLKPKEL